MESDAPMDLFLEHMELSEKIARSWKNAPGADADDLIQDAQKALFRAATDFDSSKKVPFESYAGRVIRNALTDTYRKGTRHADYHPVSLDSPIGDDGLVQGDLFESQDKRPDRLVIESDCREKIREALKTISEREQTIVLQVLYENRSNADVANELGISKQAVNKTLHQALEKLRNHFKSMNIHRYKELGLSRKEIRGERKGIVAANSTTSAKEVMVAQEVSSYKISQQTPEPGKQPLSILDRLKVIFAKIFS